LRFWQARGLPEVAGFRGEDIDYGPYAGPCGKAPSTRYSENAGTIHTPT